MQNRLNGHAWRHSFMGFSKLKAMVIYVVKSANANDVLASVYFICLQKYWRARLLEATCQGSTNSTSKIDAVARILFPVSFGLFNITYWLSYFHPQKPFEWTDHMLKGNFRSQCFRSQIFSLDHKRKIFDKWRLPLIITY